MTCRHRSGGTPFANRLVGRLNAASLLTWIMSTDNIIKPREAARRTSEPNPFPSLDAERFVPSAPRRLVKHESAFASFSPNCAGLSRRVSNQHEPVSLSAARDLPYRDILDTEQAGRSLGCDLGMAGSASSPSEPAPGIHFAICRGENSVKGDYDAVRYEV